jgi:hypothetical protein
MTISPWPHSQDDDETSPSTGAGGEMITELPRPETAESSAPLTPENIPFSNLQNPSDALGILAQVAQNDEDGVTGLGEAPGLPDHSGAALTQSERAIKMMSSVSAHSRPSLMGGLPNGHVTHRSSLFVNNSLGGGLKYPPVEEGHLTITQVDLLVRRYLEFYHPYFPLCPTKFFDSGQLVQNITEEPVLTTAILVVSSKDLVDQPQIYETCKDHMKSLVSDLASGGDASLGAVEALLIMAEWAPYTQRSQSGNVGRGEEDKESWMHVGLALRMAYFLGLDKYSFRVKDDGRDPQLRRKMLIWSTCFISDRQISIRIGKAFWSRGPGPLTSLRREDWPSLYPKSPSDEDYASIFQANIEMTLIFTNVHDVLYSMSPGSSFRAHLSGGYFKFIDDFRSAVSLIVFFIHHNNGSG